MASSQPGIRLSITHQDWPQVFLAAPMVLEVIDTYGVELIHPMREGRSPQQIGRKGLSNHRWMVGGKLCLLLHRWGLIVAWECATAKGYFTRLSLPAPYARSPRALASVAPG